MNARIRPPTTAGLLRAAFPARHRPKVAGHALGLHPDATREWIYGRRSPSADRLLAMATESAPLRRELMRALQEIEDARLGDVAVAGGGASADVVGGVADTAGDADRGRA